MEDKKLLWVVIFSALSGNAGTLVNAYSPNVRADPFTSSDALKLEAKMTDRCHALSDRVIRNELILKDILEHEKFHHPAGAVSF